MAKVTGPNSDAERGTISVLNLEAGLLKKRKPIWPPFYCTTEQCVCACVCVCV